jgi:hypothetical protein
VDFLAGGVPELGQLVSGVRRCFGPDRRQTRSWIR